MSEKITNPEIINTKPRIIRNATPIPLFAKSIGFPTKPVNISRKNRLTKRTANQGTIVLTYVNAPPADTNIAEMSSETKRLIQWLSLNISVFVNTAKLTMKTIKKAAIGAK